MSGRDRITTVADRTALTDLANAGRRIARICERARVANDFELRSLEDALPGELHLVRTLGARLCRAMREARP